MKNKNNRSQIRIAIFDSDNMFGRQLQASLEEEGYSVEFCRNYQQSIQGIISWHPHIIISDFVFYNHNVDYFDFAEKIISELEDVRLVVVSSKHLEQQVLAHLTNLSGVSLTLQKPVDLVTLVESINELTTIIERPTEKSDADDENLEDYSMNNEAIEREIAKLHFEGKDLPRFIKSILSLSRKAQEQPHRMEFFKEAVLQCESALKAVKEQKLSNLIDKFELVHCLLLSIKDNGFHPSLSYWQELFQVLENFSTTPEESCQNTHDTEITPTAPADTTHTSESNLKQCQSLLPQLIQGLAIKEDQVKLNERQKPSLKNEELPVRVAVITNAADFSIFSQVANYKVSTTILESPAQLIEFKDVEEIEMVILDLEALQLEKQIRENIAEASSIIKSIPSLSSKPIMVLSSIGSLHSRIYTAHQQNTYWINTSEYENKLLLCDLLARVARLNSKIPNILILSSDIPQSDQLMREFSKKAKVVDVVADADSILRSINCMKPDLIYLSEAVEGLLCYDIVRAIRVCSSNFYTPIVTEIECIEDSSLVSAYIAGADIILPTNINVSTKVETCLQLLKSRNLGRFFESVASPKFKGGISSVRRNIESEFEKAVKENLSYSLCFIDVQYDRFDLIKLGTLINNSFSNTTKGRIASLRELSNRVVLISLFNASKQEIKKAISKIQTDASCDNDLKVDTNSWLIDIKSYPEDCVDVSAFLDFVETIVQDL